MSLTLSLKPGEKIIVGGAVLRNGPSPARITLENQVPVLRQKDILKPEDANTPCKRVYLVVQLMYIDPQNARTSHRTFWDLAREILQGAPSTHPYITAIGDHILRDEFYQALKAAHRLIDYERELLECAEQALTVTR